ncbi:MAG: FGGY family carbohydrate kinase [Victivallaceae bacterium]|nr:FGGY family carbohydrate kinase [Victivallaceae bacterium]
MTNSVYLGIDVGSSRVKAAGFDRYGRLRTQADRAYAYQTPSPERMILDSRQVLDSALEVIAQCVHALPDGESIAAIAVSSQGEAFTPIDRHGTILAPAMISGDTRATEEITRFSADFGLERLYEITGHTPSAMFSLGKLLWLAKHEPQLRAKAAKFLCFEDLLVHALTGRAAMGFPLAARTMLFDGKNHCWSREILDAAGFRAEEFADPLPCGAIAGTVPDSIAHRLGLGRGVVVAAGGHDQIMGALGCGAWESNTAMYAAGSVECFVPVMESRVLSAGLRQSNLCTYDFALPGKFASVAYSLTGSNLLEYFRREFAPEYDFTQLLDTMPEEPTRILTLPYFTASGTPYFDTETPACVFNWRLSTTRGELLKGLQEGIALEMKLNAELLEASSLRLTRLIATGGGFRHPAVVQLHADVLNLPIALTDVTESGCRGAALLARSALEQCAPDRLDHAKPELVRLVEPDAQRAKFYSEKFECWKRHSQLMRGNHSCLMQK